ncbi:MAG: LPS export ABC transporter permease LptG [Bdellovibrionaceae bacterium]|nr:LPS export ABC transporter permease LptG [Pseudobdellovibrionaceae bacterium]MBX3032325.1 LPS export ABC transporter permease LptG [Pseudobdellovibrionaceae bacterium]
MSRIDRYISMLFWTYFFGGLLVFATIFLAMDAMTTMVSYKGVSTSALMGYYLSYAPEVIRQMLPVASLLGAVLTLSTLNKANELVALFASGMSLLRVSASILVWVTVICVASYVMSDRLIPVTTRKKDFIFFTEIEKKPDRFSVVKTDRIWYRSKNTIFNIKTLNPDSSKAQGLTMYFFSDDWDLLQMLTAQTVEIQGKIWLLSDGSVTVFSADSSFPLTSNFKTKTLPMGEDSQDLTESGQSSNMLTQSELSRFIDRNREAGLDTLNYEVDYHARFGFAVSGLVMVLLGIPFSVGRARSGGIMMNLGIVLALVFGYWVLYSSALNLGKHGQLPPIAAAWLPNLLMAGLALFLLKRLKR